MPNETRIVQPGPRAGTVRTSTGQVLSVPDSWELLAPGDAALTRRVKAGGPSWTVQEKKGRRTFSRGVWAPRERIEAIQTDLEKERSTESYRKRRQSDAKRREKKQTEYVGEFHTRVLEFLDFAPRYSTVADELAAAVTKHATPVGSGTVARTQRIPVEKRAESAVIAWMRHQTTAYDNLKIARVKGQRREVRRMLADKSRQLLEDYRAGRTIPATCPLQVALSKSAGTR
jgi:hypothetical protein